MSGGVDSSTVAAMLRAEGHNVVGLTMQLWNQRRLAGREGMPEQVQGRCCSIEDVYDARRVAEGLGIPYYVVNHQERFEKDVVRPFVRIECQVSDDRLRREIDLHQLGPAFDDFLHFWRCGIEDPQIVLIIDYHALHADKMRIGRTRFIPFVIGKCFRLAIHDLSH